MHEILGAVANYNEKAFDEQKLTTEDNFSDNVMVEEAKASFDTVRIHSPDHFHFADERGEQSTTTRLSGQRMRTQREAGRSGLYARESGVKVGNVERQAGRQKQPS